METNGGNVLRTTLQCEYTIVGRVSSLHSFDRGSLLIGTDSHRPVYLEAEVGMQNFM